MKEDYEHLMKVFEGIIEKPVNKSLLISTLQRFLPYTQNTPIPEEESFLNISNLSPQQQQYLQNSLSDCAKGIDFILESGDIQLAEEFADELFKIGSEFQIQAIIKYASSLKENCESFNIDSVETALKAYQKNQKLWSLK